jgi:hypothetical protein
MKQTAVEWQFSELERVNFEYATSKITPRDFQEQREKILRQSNEMFKQQIIEAHTIGQGENVIFPNKEAEQYHNETFNK